MTDSDLIVFEIFPWNKNFETSIEIIDEQHKELVNILNKLAVHLANRSSDVKLNDIFDELANYADYHFKTEEKIWSENFKDDEWYTEHEKTHESFIDEVIKIKKNDVGKPLDDVVYDIVSMLSKWLAYHILDTDKRMALAVLSMNTGISLEESKNISNEKMSGSMHVVIDTVLTMYDTLSTRTLDLMREKSLRKKAEEDLKRSEERWKFIIESDTENVWDWDIENDKLSQTDNIDSIYKITGSRLKSIDSKSSNIHPADIDRVNRDFNAHIKGKSDFYVNKHRLLRKDGSWSWILSRGKVISRSEDGTPLRMIGTHSDITEKELAKLIYENSSQAIFVCTAENKIISINKAFTEITGYDEKDAIGKNPKFLSSGKHDKKFYDDLWKQINSLGHWSGKIYNKSKSGAIFLEELYINRIVDDNGNVDYYYSMFSDITEKENDKVELEKRKHELIHQSRLAQMGEMISMIAHQWRQPITSIAMGANNILADIGLQSIDENTLKESANNILKSTEELSDTIDDFRNFYKPNKQSVIIKLEDVIEKSLKIIKPSLVNNNINIIKEYNSDEQIELYDREIMQVILNILKNSEDILKDEKIENRKIIIKTKNRTISITDNGTGISEDIIDNIFNPYFSTKDEKNGTGLGLYMSKTIIEQHHNGKLSVKNTDDGVCFTIELGIVSKK